MGDLRLAYEQRDGRDLVFALLPTGQAVWGMDAGTRQEWWYAPELADSVLPDLRAALLEQQPVAVPTPTGPGVDLASHRPGHAVLAQIEAQHRQATASVIDGMPGTLDDGVVAWCVGYVGEAQVGEELARLGPEWHTLHAVPVGDRGSDIDHVVIGHGGVFTINTKHHAGVNVDVKGDGVFVARTYQHYVRNARKEAERAQGALSTFGASVQARPLIVTVNAKLRVKQAPDGVAVLDSRSLVGWLQSQPPVLTVDQGTALFEHLRWSGRWTDMMPPSAAASWVDGFARQLATEQAIAKSAPRWRTATSPSLSSPPRQGATRSGRRTSSRPAQRTRRGTPIWLDLVRLVGGLLIFFLIVKMAPMLIESFTRSLSTPKPGTSTSAPSLPVVAAGASCSVRGERAVTAAGAALVCAPARGSTTTLVWRAPA